MNKTLTRYFLLWVLFFSVFTLTLIALRISVSPADAAESTDGVLHPEIAFATPAGFYTDSVSVFLSGTED